MAECDKDLRERQRRREGAAEGAGQMAGAAVAAPGGRRQEHLHRRGELMARPLQQQREWVAAARRMARSYPKGGGSADRSRPQVWPRAELASDLAA